MERPLLELKDLTVEFNRRGQWSKAVNGLNLAIKHGETLALVGESGSGKSVSSLAIMRLLDAGNSRVSGQVLLQGNDIMTLSPRQMRDVRGNRISMIFQEPMTCLNPVMTVGSQLVEAIRAHRGVSVQAARTEALRLFDRVQIPAAAERLDDHPQRFSGGMRQRIMIAMALALKPDVLIADEPTTALDVTVQAQILSLLNEIQAEDNMAMLFITHDMGVVAEMADRVQVMLRGDAIETGTAEQIFGAPREPYTKALLAAVPRLGSMKGATQPMMFDDSGSREPEAAAPARQGPLLQVNNLTTRFDLRGGWNNRVQGRIHAVENVSLELGRQETLAIVGESGCGKSTLGNSIARLLPPTSGSVRLNGTDILQLSPEALRRARRAFQVIFQDPYASLNPRMTVGEIVAEPILLHGLRPREQITARTAEILIAVGLSPTMTNRYPHEFSGGQRQRICIARALASEPELIVADECVSALDVSIKAQVVNLMLSLQRSLGLSYLFISHDMAIVERISHRVCVMYLGEIVEIGARADVFENPQHPYTRKLLAAVPVADPSRRRHGSALPANELRSAIHPVSYRPPQRQYREVRDGHLVMVQG